MFSTGLAVENGVIYAIEGGFGATPAVFRFEVIPEPATVLLVAAGLAAPGAARRRSPVAAADD